MGGGRGGGRRSGGMGAAGEKAPSALQDNIAQKKDTSYYFAHAPRETGEAPAPLPVPVVLARERAEPEEERTETVSKYQLMDDGVVVKVYVPLEGIGTVGRLAGGGATDVDPEAVQWECGERSLSLSVSKLKPGTRLQLVVRELHAEIIPRESSIKVLRNKILISLKKSDEKKAWSKICS